MITADEVRIEDWTPGRRLWLKTPGRDSMEVAAEILRWIEGLGRCSIPDAGGRSAGHGNLVEVGITIKLEDLRVSVMCIYDD